MGHGIDGYRELAGRMQRTAMDGRAMTHNKQGEIVIRMPLKTPESWMKFKAALSHIPLLGRIRWLKEAKQDLALFPQRATQYKLKSEQIMTGFLGTLRLEYGSHVAELSTRGVKDSAPLTGRLVRQVLDKADRIRENEVANQRTLQRFLHPPAPLPFRRDFSKPSEGGIEDYFGQGTLTDNVGQERAQWMESFMRMKVAEHPGYSTGNVDNRFLEDVAGEALGVLREFKDVKGFTEEQLKQAFMASSACKGDSAQLVSSLHENIVHYGLVAPALDIARQDSMISSISRAYSEKFKLPPIPEKVLKSIAGNLKETIDSFWDELPEKLNCTPDVVSIRDALEPVLRQKLETLLGEHYEAVRLIGDSTIFTETQKTAMLELASTRRLDPVQVREYEQACARMLDQTALIHQAIAEKNTTLFVQTFSVMLNQYETGLTGMMRHGFQNWDSSLRAKSNELFREMARLTFGSVHPLDAEKIFNQLTSPMAHEMLTAVRMLPDGRANTLFPELFSILVEEAGQRGQIAPEVVEQRLNELNPPMPLSEMSELSLHVALGTDQTTGHVHPESRHRGKVRQGFNGTELRTRQREQWLNYTQHGSSLDQNTGLSNVFYGDIGRSNMYLNGKLLSEIGARTHESKAEVERQFLAAFTENEVTNTALAGLVSSCMSQESIKNQFIEMLRDACGENAEKYLPGHNSTTFEAWKDDQGNWNIRSIIKKHVTYVLEENTINEEDCKTGPEALIFGSITYRISKESIANSQPELTMVDSRTYFSF